MIVHYRKYHLMRFKQTLDNILKNLRSSKDYHLTMKEKIMMKVWKN